MRSGDFVAGSFPEYVRRWAPDDTVGKIWWQPLHQDRWDGLTVRVLPSGSPEDARTLNFSTIASNAESSFYPSSVEIPDAGGWRLVATSGPDWGCFELTLPG